MALNAYTVSSHLTDYDKIKQLYHSSFPEDELVKWSWLMLKARSEKVEFLAYYDDTQFLGFSYMIHLKKECDFLFFFAVDPQLQSKGYGGQILDWLNTKHPDIPIVLEAEALDDQAANASQRQRRMDFYAQHGFHDTQHRVNEEGMIYAVLANQPQFDIQQLTQAYHWFWRPFFHRQNITIK